VFTSGNESVNIPGASGGAIGGLTGARRFNANYAVTPCYHCRMFNFGRPKTAADWVVHIAGAIVAIFLVWWMLRMYVL
jgi:hypothetical protein